MQSPEIEFVLVQHPWMENDCLYADILLPINTKFEERDIAVDSSNGYTNVMMIEPQCIEPRGESKSDYEAVGEVAKKMGLYEEFTGGKTEEEWIREGFENSGCQERVTWEEFVEKGYYAAPTSEGWEDNPRGFAPFAEDPEANPTGHAVRKAGILFHGAGASFPRRRVATAVPEVHRGRRPPVRVAAHGARQDVPLPHRVQPSAVARAREHGRHHVVPRDRDVQGEGPGRVPVRARVDQPGGRPVRTASPPATW